MGSWVEVFLHTPTAVPMGKEYPVPIGWGDWVGTRDGLGTTKEEKNPLPVPVIRY